MTAAPFTLSISLTDAARWEAVWLRGDVPTFEIARVLRLVADKLDEGAVASG